ncbi:uncharacterized mitochondrial protein AtMg00240-like [Lathyrus oleraceus]|uniref:uncharacterized mitochondrial protein AtMg00240-like n=1 Tax=Pisum sativum TaxID=3888 RepID=UPI0021CF50C1|nr:uncharacterized mitochondrial protein AtMg00240-like [Pisum sativum]
MNPNSKILSNQWKSLKDSGRYHRLVGKLNYLTVTRPDITFTISIVSQFLNAHFDSHWDAVIRILRYINNAPERGLLYEDNGDAKIICYSVADWAGSPSDRRSTFGYCVMIGGVTTIFAIAPGQMQNKSNISRNPVSLNALA